jgi:hypothetical protein
MVSVGTRVNASLSSGGVSDLLPEQAHPYRLRAATPADVVAIDALQLASARAAFGHIGPVSALEPSPERL